MKTAKLMKNTRDYHSKLIDSLSNPKEATAYLRVALEEYEEDGAKTPIMLQFHH